MQNDELIAKNELTERLKYSSKYNAPCPDWVYKSIEATHGINKEIFDRAITLLQATRELLNQQLESSYILNLLAETIYYDEAECDGNCLLEDIDALLFEMGIGDSHDID